MAGWFDDNLPRTGSSPGVASGGGGPAPAAGSSAVYSGGVFAGGGATGVGSAGGWNDPNVQTPSSKILAQAFQQGLSGQAAVDWATAHGAPGISYNAGNNQFGLPDGAYVAPNPQNPQTFDLISRGGGGGGGGGAGGGFSPVAPHEGASYTAPTFAGPTGLNYMNDPGYLERMKMGTDAIQGAAAAKGSILGGGTLKALERYGQDYGTNEFGGVFGRGLQTFNANLGAGQFAAQFNQGVGQQNYLNRYGQYTDYQGYLNNIANRGFQAANAGYVSPPG